MSTPKNPKMKLYTIKDFDRDFPNDAACLEWLKNFLYPNGITCENLRCKRYGQVTKHYRVKSRPSYSCAYCGHHVHPTAGTIFHKSPTPLTKWFHGVFLMASTRCGISAKQLQREIGVTYKTAWRMFKQIRVLLEENKTSQMTGRVEVDETYIGGKKRYRGAGRGSHREGLTPVMGVAQRQGRVAARVVPNTTTNTLLPVVKQYVLPDSIIYTDEYTSYDSLYMHGYEHHRIPHSQKVYVMGDIHTNTVEGFWSLVKRGISGVYHSVSAKHLQSYLNEYTFRYNHRTDLRPMFLAFLGQVALYRVGGKPFSGHGEGLLL